MNRILTCFLFLLSLRQCYTEDLIINKTELVFGFMVHRHGDRAPLPFAIQYMTDTDNAMDLTNKYGYGQLTDGGRRRGYELGKFIRHRYGSLLSRHYNKSEIYIRSTDSTRTKMTVLAAMAAVYPPGQDNWSNDVNWTPVPYTTLPVRDDDMLTVFNCPAFIEEMNSRGERAAPELAKYDPLLDKLSAILDLKITRNFLTLIQIYDAFTSQMSLGIPFIPEVEKLLPDVLKAGDEGFAYIFADGDKGYLAMQSGVLLREFFTEVDKIISGKDVPQVRIYSAHDVNVFLLALISRAKPMVGAPFYGSLFSLEVRRVLETGQYIVVPVYLENPNSDLKYLKIDGCGDICDLQMFRELTSKHVVDVKRWRTLCEYRDDYEIDTSEID